MSNVVAVVKGVVGQVIALSPEGIQRLLVEGDRLFRGDQVMTGQQGMLSLQLQGGQALEIGQNSQWLASTETDAQPTQRPRPPPTKSSRQKSCNKLLLQASTPPLNSLPRRPARVLVVPAAVLAEPVAATASCCSAKPRNSSIQL